MAASVRLRRSFLELKQLQPFFVLNQATSSVGCSREEMSRGGEGGGVAELLE